MSALKEVRVESLEVAMRTIEAICQPAVVRGPADLRPESLLQLSFDAGRRSVYESLVIEIEKRKKNG